MPPKYQELKAERKNEGVGSQPGKGSHTDWTHYLVPEALVTSSGQDGDDARDYHVRGVRAFLAKAREAKRWLRA